MSEAKGPVEGPYTVKEEKGVTWLYLGSLRLEGHTRMFLTDVKRLCEALNTAHSVGAQAERERCLSIIERWRPMTKQSWVTVSDEIGGKGERG